MINLLEPSYQPYKGSAHCKHSAIFSIKLFNPASNKEESFCTLCACYERLVSLKPEGGYFKDSANDKTSRPLAPDWYQAGTQTSREALSWNSYCTGLTNPKQHDYRLKVEVIKTNLLLALPEGLTEEITENLVKRMEVPPEDALNLVLTTIEGYMGLLKQNKKKPGCIVMSNFTGIPERYFRSQSYGVCDERGSRTVRTNNPPMLRMYDELRRIVGIYERRINNH